MIKLTFSFNSLNNNVHLEPSGEAKSRQLYHAAEESGSYKKGLLSVTRLVVKTLHQKFCHYRYSNNGEGAFIPHIN
jgi:hypothetical protein